MKRIEIDTFLKFQFLSSPQFSPDGTKIAFTVSVPDLDPTDIWRTCTCMIWKLNLFPGSQPR